MASRANNMAMTRRAAIWRSAVFVPCKAMFHLSPRGVDDLLEPFELGEEERDATFQGVFDPH